MEKRLSLKDYFKEKPLLYQTQGVWPSPKSVAFPPSQKIFFFCFLGTVTLFPFSATETGSTKRGPLLWSVKLYAQRAQFSIKKYMLHLVLLGQRENG